PPAVRWGTLDPVDGDLSSNRPKPGRVPPWVIPPPLYTPYNGPSGNGKPELDASWLNPDDVVASLAFLSNQLAGAQMSGAKVSIQTNEAGQLDQTKRILDQTKQMAEKAREAAEKQGQDKIASWFKTVFSFIGAVVGLVATVVGAGASLGAAAPL